MVIHSGHGNPEAVGIWSEFGYGMRSDSPRSLVKGGSINEQESEAEGRGEPHRVAGVSKL